MDLLKIRVVGPKVLLKIAATLCNPTLESIATLRKPSRQKVCRNALLFLMQIMNPLQQFVALFCKTNLRLMQIMNIFVENRKLSLCSSTMRDERPR